MIYPYHQCPRFDDCTINVCPLDPLMKEKNRVKGEKDCPMEKEVRMKLGKDLPWLGLKPAEFAAKNRFDRLSEKEKEIMREKARNRAKVINSQLKFTDRIKGNKNA